MRPARRHPADPGRAVGERRVRAADAARTMLRPARVAIRPALMAGTGLRNTMRYWRAERRTLRQGFVALSVSALGNIPTGIALGAMGTRLRDLPGLIILIPGAIGMRGSIFGALASRLGTGMNAGLLRFTRDRTSLLGQNVVASIYQTLTGALFLALVAEGFAAVVGLPTIPLLDFILISVLGGVFASLVVLVVTVWLARTGQRRDWDLDAVASPVITFVGDLVTLPSLYVVSLLVGRGSASEVLGVACATICVFAAIASFRLRLPIARRIVRESALTIAIASTIDIVAGLAIEDRLDRFTTLPALLILLPSFLSNAGALGGIVSSRLASKLHLGAIRPRLVPEQLTALDASLAAPWALVNFALVGAVAHLVSRAVGFASPGMAAMVGVSVVGGLIATLVASFIAYLVAVATFRFDLDPDNHGVALVTSMMDLVGVLCILAGISITGVLS